MSDQSSNLGLPFLMPAQAQKHVTVNESLLRLDALVQLAIVSATTAAQPGAPSDGQCYVLPSGKTGAAWGAMADGAIAYYRDGAWEAITPREGWYAFVKDANATVVYDGAAWIDEPVALADDQVTFAKLLNATQACVIGATGAGSFGELTPSDARTLIDAASTSSVASAIAGAISDTAYNATTWDGVTTIAPSKNAVRDKFESLGALAALNTVGATQIDNDAVTFAKVQNVATDRLLGRDSASSGDIEELTVSGGIEFTGAGGLQTSAFTGDVTKSAGATALAIADDAVTFAKLLNATQASFIGATGAGAFGERTFSQVLSDIAAPLAGGTFTGAVGGVTLALAQGTITNPATPFAITATWNDAADTFDAIDVNVTNTASASASRLLNLRVGGSTVCRIERTGHITTSGGVFPANVETGSGGAFTLFNRGGMRAPSDGEFTLRNYANTTYGGLMIARMRFSELSADPSDPSEGQSVIWQSDGAGAGDDGDIMIKITAGGVTKTGTLVDFSAI